MRLNGIRFDLEEYNRSSDEATAFVVPVDGRIYSFGVQALRASTNARKRVPAGVCGLG